MYKKNNKQDDWDEFYKFRVRINTFVSLVPCTALLVFISDVLFDSNLLSFIIVIFSFIFGLYLLFKCGFLRCPRCHNLFFLSFVVFPSSKCRHCGLPIDARKQERKERQNKKSAPKRGADQANYLKGEEWGTDPN